MCSFICRKFLVLMYMGGKPAEGIYVLISRIGQHIGFIYFCFGSTGWFLETPRQP